MTLESRMAHVEEMRARSAEGGGPERVARQHAEGKLTARERLDLLLDPGSFFEVDRLVTHRCRDFGAEKVDIPGDGVVCQPNGSSAADAIGAVTIAPSATIGPRISRPSARRASRRSMPRARTVSA